MAYTQMTPQERMQRAALIRAQREARLGYTPTVTEDLSRYLTPTEQSVGSVAPVSEQRDDDTDALEAIGKGVATGLDLGANVGIGALKSLEGIFDIGASLVGTVGGWFSEDFKREVEKVVAYQAINEWLENPLDELGLKHSYLNDSEIGEIIGGVAQGVGGMLPAVAVTAITAGAAAPVAVQQALSLGTMVAGAAGNASEEALNEGADLGAATNYGLVSGSIEGVTEKLTGGASKWLIGKGLIKVGNVAAQGGKRILKNMAGEAVEEGLATLVNPLAKTTYKGADALSEYGEAEFYGDVLRDAASGALVSGAFEQTVGRVARRAGADADISDAQEAIDNIVNKQRAEQAKGIYENSQLDADAMKNLENISKALKKASPEKRAKLIERHDLSQAFDESGEIKPEFAARFTGGTTTAPNGTTSDTESGRGYNKAYYSADKRGSESQIASEVESIQESLRNVERNRLEKAGLDPSAADNITIKVFDGELSETGKKNLANAHGFINNVSDRTRTGMSMVVVDSDGAMNGVSLNDSNTIYIDASTIEDGTYLNTMVEEVAHFSEGTQSYGKLLSFIAKDEDLFSEVVGELVADGNGYGFTADTFLSLVEKSEAGDRQSLTGEEKRLANELGAHMVAETFGNETFMQKVIKGEPTLAEKMISRVKALKNALSGNESSEARAERKRLEKAEKLWMKSVEDAGYKYVKGKLIKRRREKEEEEKKKATSSTENVQEAEGESGAQFSLVGKSKDGRNIYKSNYPENTPKAVKQAEIIRLVQEVWSKNPIELTIVDNGKERKITAKFNPELSERSDLSKIAFGNRKGNASEKRITLDLSSDLYHIAETSTYVRSKEEIGKDNPAHDGVLEWHYFVTNLIYEDFDGKRIDCHMNIDVKEKNDGTWFYSFAIEKGVAPQTLLAVVTDESATTPNSIINQSSSKINPSEQNSSEKVSTDDSASFSLPNKGGEAKKKAERSRAKTYTRSESNAIVDVMIGDSVFGYGEYVGTLKGKGNIVDALWVKLNSTDEKGRKKYAFKLADAVIDSMVLNLAVDDPVMEVYTDRVEKLGAYVRRLDLTSIKGELNNTGNAQHYRSRWQRYDGKGMTPDQIVSELADNGIIIEADNPADILFEMDRMYTEALQGIKDNSNLILEQVLDKAELDAYRNDLARRFLEASNELGSASKLSREYYEEYLQLSAEYDHAVELLEKDMKKEIDANTEKTMKDIEKRKQQLEREREKFAGWRKKLRESDDEFRDKMRDKFRNQEKTAKLIREVVFRADRLKKLQLGKMHNAAEFNPQEFRKTIGALGSIVRGGNLSVKKTREVSGKLSAWLRWHMKQIDARLSEDEGRKFELNKIVAYLDEISDPMQDGVPLSVDELKNLSYAMARLTTYASEYGKIIRNGKRIDALPIVEGYIDRSDKTRKIPRGAIRTLREWYIGKFADPATVMRYADGYDEHGFFTETFNEFREGAIKVEVTRMELMEDYVEFLDKHKKYSDHLREYVEYRGKRVPRNVLISLWMTTKRKQAQLGLLMEGAQFRAEPDTKAAKKNDDGTRVFDIAPFGDPMRDTKTDPYTVEEIETIMEGIRTEIEKSFTDTDRSYIAMVEGIFKACGEIKRSVDMERLGYTNVDEKQYYFPIARADIAQTIEQESWQQGLDRVSHLSMNKDTVKGAHNRLYLSGVDAILARHVNQVSLYNGIATAVDNFNLLVNLKINEDGAAITVNNTVNRTDYGKAALDYLKKLKQDIERVNRVDLDDAGVTKFLSYLRGAYATSVLGANPKVWVTQASSLIAAGNVLDGKSIAEGMALKMGKVNGEDEVDIYCPLAKLRNDTNTAYEAQSVSARVPNALRKTSEFLMKPIGAVDRFVIERLWCACQVQVQSKGGAKVGTKENKVEAGKLLQKVILETQQNSLATERSSAMRSTNEFMKSVTMFSADAMKMIGRFFDAYGEASFIRQRLKDQTLSKTEREKLEARKKVVDKQVVKSTSVLLSSAVFMMAIAAAFKALLGQYEEKEPEEIALDMTADGVGNLLSGLPILRDVYSFYAEGYELNMNVITYVNGLMEAVGAFGTNISDLTSGKEVTSQAWASAIRKGFFAGGQILGLPTKNVYKYATRVIELVSPETGYAIDSAFVKPSIKADLKKAIEAGDTKMVARIAEIATSENYGMYSESTRKELKPLVEAGYTVFPRTVGDTVTVDGETYEFSSAQKKRFEKVYAVSDKAVEELVSLKQFGSATDEVKAKALKYVYDTYYSVALDDLMGTDTTQKSVLFAEVIDVELLAMVVAYVSTLTADKDKDGKTINGSRKQKIVAYVNSLNLSAAEKYMIMGYLGYKNTNGKNQVESLINRSSLSRTEGATLLAYSGY